MKFVRWDKSKFIECLNNKQDIKFNDNGAFVFSNNFLEICSGTNYTFNGSLLHENIIVKICVKIF